jgi:hypothetical protein
MKKSSAIFILLITAAIIFSSCKGNQGPSGPKGGNVAAISYQNSLYPSDAYSGSMDTDLVSTSPEADYGQCGLIEIGHNGAAIGRGLMKFQIIGISPANVKVTSAYLTLYAVGGNSATITAYAVTSYWYEGGGDCSGTGTAESTWNSCTAYATWLSPGGDYNMSPASGSVMVPDVSAAAKYVSLKLDNSLVQSWMDNPDSNYGLILREQAENQSTNSCITAFASNQFGTAAYGPKLTIYYEIP